MARRIRFADVRLDFNDGSGSEDAAGVMDQDLAEQIPRDLQRRPGIEGARQLHR
jgi:hypothetical protein